MSPAELRALDDEFVRRGLDRARDPVVRRLRRELRPVVVSDERRVEACRAAWTHLASLGLLSEVVVGVPTEEAAT